METPVDEVNVPDIVVEPPTKRERLMATPPANVAAPPEVMLVASVELLTVNPPASMTLPVVVLVELCPLYKVSTPAEEKVAALVVSLVKYMPPDVPLVNRMLPELS